MRDKYFFIVGFLLALAACSQPADGPTIPFVQKKTNGGLENAYYTSYAFDSCGDGDTGQRYRAALRMKAKSCTLPPEIDAAFSRSMARIDEIMPQKIGAFHKKFGDHPEKSGDYQCSEILAQRDAILDDATSTGCETGSGPAGPARISPLKSSN